MRFAVLCGHERGRSTALGSGRVGAQSVRMRSRVQNRPFLKVDSVCVHICVHGCVGACCILE